MRGRLRAVGPEPIAGRNSAERRLRQMKSLADEFAVTMLGWKADDSDREELRRLPKEFFRYKPDDGARE